MGAFAIVVFVVIVVVLVAYARRVGRAEVAVAVLQHRELELMKAAEDAKGGKQLANAEDREDRKRRHRGMDDAAAEIEEDLGTRVMWVRRDLDHGDGNNLNVVTGMPAEKMKAILISHGTIRRAREAGFDALVIRGSMDKAEFMRLESEMGGDEAKTDAALAQCEAMEERDMVAIELTAVK